MYKLANTTLSPAMCVFGRSIKDFIPVLPGRYKPDLGPTKSTYHLALLHRQQFMYHRRVLCHQLRPIYEPPATILEPPTLDETTSTPVRSKPATCGTCTPLWRLSVSPIPYPPSSLAKGQSQTPVSRKPQQCPSAIATRGPTRTRKRPAWQSSGDYDNIMSTG